MDDVLPVMGLEREACFVAKMKEESIHSCCCSYWSGQCGGFFMSRYLIVQWL